MSDTEHQNLDRCDEDIAKLYLKTAVQHFKKIQTAIRSKSPEDVQRFAHKLAGSSAFLGLKDLGQRLGDLEKAAASGDLKEVARLLSLAQEEFDRIQAHKSAKPHTQNVVQSPVATSKRKHKVFIVDDHPLIREGLERLIDSQTDLKVCGQSSTAFQALKVIPELKPDLVILDITLATSNGMGLIKDMKLRSLKSLILVLSMHDESLYAERALKAGAKGYIMKREAPKELVKAIRRVLSGEIYLSEVMGAKMLHKIANNSPTDEKSLPEGALSDRELQTFQLIGQGRGTREIAEELHISPKTVESYRAHIKIKMNLKNAHELTQHAVHWVESNHLN